MVLPGKNANIRMQAVNINLSVDKTTNLRGMV